MEKIGGWAWTYATFFFFFFLLLSICSKNGGGQDHDGHINYHGDSSLILIQRELVKG